MDAAAVAALAQIEEKVYAAKLLEAGVPAEKICKLAKDGVREELAENKHAALDIYGRAQTLLQFLIGEGPGLHVQPPLVIDGSAHARLSQLSATLASRQSSLSRRQRV